MSKNIVRLAKDQNEIQYRCLNRGRFFRFENRHNDKNIYIKLGTKAVLLTNGSEVSLDQERLVVPIREGETITIQVGNLCNSHDYQEGE